jgi:uncharacterized membrane protein
MTTQSASTTNPLWAQRIDRAVAWSLRHWLLFANTLVLIYGGVPWLSPLAYAEGYSVLGRLLFLVYTPFCHQEPDRSFWLYGHQVAFCHREAAMYTALLVGGLAFGLLRRFIRPVPLRVGGLLLVPMLLDGGSHMLDDLFHLGLRSADNAIGTPNFWLRMLTGVLFAIAIVITVYPRLDRDLRPMGERTGT